MPIDDELRRLARMVGDPLALFRARRIERRAREDIRRAQAARLRQQKEGRRRWNKLVQNLHEILMPIAENDYEGAWSGIDEEADRVASQSIEAAYYQRLSFYLRDFDILAPSGSSWIVGELAGAADDNGIDFNVPAYSDEEIRRALYYLYTSQRPIVRGR